MASAKRLEWRNGAKIVNWLRARRLGNQIQPSSTRVLIVWAMDAFKWPENEVGYGVSVSDNRYQNIHKGKIYASREDYWIGSFYIVPNSLKC